ncbi:hypothetical protein CO726_13475 [Bacillus fungorum]|uniref:Uncharacterized protein n=1 Tax=Bacillus fungorum TaxID=2039284 RepID=A0A2G6QCP2_9BACI|nr:hypothetical protein [Bacillus fungorum]PIE94592.1 hypothetical protein CO726_13475 [Bacillus fungorum]
MYILHPPFLKEEYGLSFGESWEIFCLKLLKIHYKTNEIEKRNPPESGIDLYFSDKKIAFQCKSIANSNGTFNYTLAEKSLQNALSIQKDLGWEKFILCINGEITGEQIKRLQKVYKNVKVMSKYFWIHLCENHPEVIQNNFRKVIDVPSSFQANKIKKISNIPQEIKDIMIINDKCFSIWIYISQNDSLIPVEVYKEMTVANLLTLIKNLLGITNKTFVQTEEVQVSCELYFGGEYISESNKYLVDLCIQPYSIIAFNINVELSDITVSSLMFNEERELLNSYLCERENFLLNCIKSYKTRGY